MGISYPGLAEFVKDCLEKGFTTRKIYERAIDRFNYVSDFTGFVGYVSKVRRGDIKGEEVNIEPEDVETLDKKYKPLRSSEKDDIDFLQTLSKHRVIKIVDLCNKLNCSPKVIHKFVDHYRSRGYEIAVDGNKVIFSAGIVSNVEEIKKPLEDKEIIFGVASDWHFGSKYVQITALNEFCDLARKKGVKHMFVPGDVTAGFNVYAGQAFDLFALSAEEQESSVITNLPEGFDWHCLGGNHDYGFIKRGGGHNPLLAISNQREDFHYVGFDEANVPILKGVELCMWHPSGGVPYALSYRLQKGIEQIAFGELTKIVRGVKERPTIRFVLAGHLHVQVQAMFGSIFGCQAGCFEGQSNYLKRKGLIPQVGGYIIQAVLGKNGLLKNFEAKFYIFEEVENDYRNYSHEIELAEITEPLLE